MLRYQLYLRIHLLPHILVIRNMINNRKNNVPVPVSVNSTHNMALWIIWLLWGIRLIIHIFFWGFFFFSLFYSFTLEYSDCLQWIECVRNGYDSDIAAFWDSLLARQKNLLVYSYCVNMLLLIVTWIWILFYVTCYILYRIVVQLCMLYMFFFMTKKYVLFLIYIVLIILL